jgi:hypothetical protein
LMGDYLWESAIGFQLSAWALQVRFSCRNLYRAAA